MNLLTIALLKEPDKNAGAQQYFGIEPRYNLADDLRAELSQNSVINIKLVRLPPLQWPKVGRRVVK